MNIDTASTIVWCFIVPTVGKSSEVPATIRILGAWSRLQFFVISCSYFAIDSLCAGYESGFKLKCFTLQPTNSLQAIVHIREIRYMQATCVLKTHFESACWQGTFNTCSRRVESSTQWGLHYRSTDQIWKSPLQYLYEPSNAEKIRCENAAI